MGRDIHNFEKRLEIAVRVIERSSLSKKDKDAIQTFNSSCFAEGLSVARVERYTYLLGRIGRDLPKGLCMAKKNDIVNYISKLERSHYSEWSKHFFKVCFKKFYKWLRQSEDYPLEVRWIKSTVKAKDNKLPEELLTQEEVKRMIEACRNPRDKALIAMLYESGYRVGELANLQLKHIAFDKYGCRALLNGKTGLWPEIKHISMYLVQYS